MDTLYDEDVASVVRTASYVSDLQRSSCDSSQSGRSRQLKEIAKLHAKEIVSLKINRKVADTAPTGGRKEKDVNHILADFDTTWIVGSERFKNRGVKNFTTIVPTPNHVVSEF